MKSIAVLGLGKVGGLAADLLVTAGFDVLGFDLSPRPLGPKPYPVAPLDVGDGNALRATLGGVDAVLSCLPYSLNTGVAHVAHGLGLHYFDLTEDVATTKAIVELADTSKGLMAPQCGLAPGFVGIVGADLIAQFETCRSCRMRDGALPRSGYLRQEDIPLDACLATQSGARYAA